jgi:phenylacetic acid degradation operon negative regulatory protein
VSLLITRQQDGQVTPDAQPDESPLPPASARSLLLTVLGEFGYPDQEPIWTTALIRVLGGLGVESHAARQAIARSSAAGWIDSERCGRAVRWRLTPVGRDIVEDGMRRTTEYLTQPAPWSGRWLVLLVSLPQQARTARKRLYGGLAWLRMGNPTAGVWLTPHVDTVDELRALIARFELTEAAISFIGRTEDVGMSNQQIVSRAWNLSELAGQYHALLDRYADQRPAPGDEVLLRHLELRNLLQRFLRLDPQLPEELLPNWIGRDAARLLRTRHEQWSAPARLRWDQLVRDCEPASSPA